MEFFTSDLAKLSISTDGSGVPIIFISGYSGNQYSWAAQNDFFSSLGYQCIHLDKRGHSNNSAITTGLRISRLAMDLKEAVDSLKLDNFHLVSHSLGCAIAFEYLSLFGEKQLNSLTIIDSSPKPVNTPGWHLGLAGLNFETIEEKSRSIATTQLTHKKIPIELLRKMKQGKQPFDFSTNQPLVLDYMSRDYRDVLQMIEIPVLYIAGRLSPIFKTELADYYTAQIKQCTSHIIQDCGHLPYAESPDEVNQVLLDFLVKY